MKKYRIIEMRKTNKEMQLQIDKEVEAKDLNELSRILKDKDSVYVCIADLLERTTET